MLIVADNDVRGAVEALRHFLQSEEWADYAAALGLRFTDFEALGLPRDAPDRTVWQVSQAAGAVLITGNRAGDAGSLDEAIRELSGSESLPVVTIGDPGRPVHDPAYARSAAIRLLEILETLDDLRGTGRLYIP